MYKNIIKIQSFIPVLVHASRFMGKQWRTSALNNCCKIKKFLQNQNLLEQTAEYLISSEYPYSLLLHPLQSKDEQNPFEKPPVPCTFLGFQFYPKIRVKILEVYKVVSNLLRYKEISVLQYHLQHTAVRVLQHSLAHSIDLLRAIYHH